MSMPVFQFVAGPDKPTSSSTLSLTARQVDGTTSQPTEVSTQPTYTTAGTLYKPENSQPLQAPLRRGRPFRNYSERFTFEQPLDTVAPARNFSDSMARTSVNSREPYSPLQQNYDRAIPPTTSSVSSAKKSPTLVTQDQGSYTMSAEAASPVVNSNTENIKDDEEQAAESDGDPSTNSLRSLTASSLKNLASYDNPNRDSARRLFQKSVTQPRTQPAPLAGAQVRGKNLALPPGLEKGIQERFQRNALMNGATYESMPSPDKYGAPPISMTQSVRTTTPTVATSSGTPYPLTAGPPGQRQHRIAPLATTVTGYPPTTQPQQQYRTHGHHNLRLQSYTLVEDPEITRSQELSHRSSATSGMMYNVHNDRLVEEGAGSQHEIKLFSNFGGQSPVHKKLDYESQRMGQDGAGETQFETTLDNSEPLTSLRRRAPRYVPDLSQPRSLDREYGTFHMSQEEMLARQAEINKRWYECPPGRLDLSDTTPLPPPDRNGNGLGAIGEPVPGNISPKKAGKQTSGKEAGPSDMSYVLSMVYPSLERFLNKNTDVPELEEDVPSAVHNDTSTSEETFDNNFDAAVGGSKC